MKNAINIFLFTILVTAFYNYVGQVVPQKETYPPEDISISENLSTDEMVEIGREIVGGKGTCLTCHTIGASTAGRFPDLANIGINAASRKQGMSAVEYIAESMYEPNAYISEGFLPGMPFISKPPISLNDQEILTIIAYMESLGGTPSVTMDTKLQWQSEEGAAPPAVADPTMSPLEQRGRELFMNNACVTCHNLDSPDKLLGPSLMDVGSRLAPEEIKESIMDPDVKLAEGFEAMKGQMKLTLTAMGIYEKL
ncbi:MAG: c-type cytochrome, partial [bacterium]